MNNKKPLQARVEDILTGKTKLINKVNQWTKPEDLK